MVQRVVRHQHRPVDGVRPLDLYHPEAVRKHRHRGVELAVELQPGGEIIGAAGLLRAMAAGGRLAIAAVTRPSHVAVQVIDTGGGVPAELQGRLFEPLLGARPGGAGLGLSTARRLARAWGGDVVFAPAPGGACFEVLIPTRPRSPAVAGGGA